ncbi:MAG: BamA/TamA family outer membrane protein [candidate division KSB1 bacterium]|nr:BamA/TamA family outer membrane protein [candidate division KSB1 bacterium]
MKKILTKIAAILLIGLLLGLPAQAQSPPENSARPAWADSVVIRTAGEVKPERITKALSRQRLLWRVGITPDSVTTAVLGWLLRHGYWNARIAKVDIRQHPRPHLWLVVEEGRRARGGVLRFRSDANVEIPMTQVRIRDFAAVDSQVDALLKQFGEAGYPFARATLDSILVLPAHGRGASYELVYRIEPGSRVIIDSIRIVGNSLTRREVILRELPVKPGMVYRESLIEAIPQRLWSLRFLRVMNEPRLYVTPQQTGILEITVQEGRSNFFNGVLGYNPGTGTQPGFLSGLIDIEFANLLGTGREIRARWEKRGPKTQDLSLFFREPWVFGKPFHLEGGFQQLIQDTSYVRRSWQFKVEWPFLEGMRLVTQLSRSAVLPDSVGLALGIPPSQATSAGFGIEYTSLDEPVNPTRGARFSTLLETIAKRLDDAEQGQGDFRQKRLLVDASWNLSLWRWQVVHVGLHWRHITTSEPFVSITDQFRFGGATTLRGYREEQFRGSRVAWATVEYRYLLGQRSRAFLFYDLGYFSRRDPKAGLIQSVKQSFGFGVRLETRIGLIGIDYGLGEGDTILQGKVHLSLINTF